MKCFTTIVAVFSLALSATAAATPDVNGTADLLPRDMSAMPRGIVDLMVKDAKLGARGIEKRAGCFSACNANCFGCGSQGCLSNCQINWYVILH